MGPDRDPTPGAQRPTPNVYDGNCTSSSGGVCSISSLPPPLPSAGAARGRRRADDVRRADVRLGAVRPVVRFAERPVFLRDPPFLRDAFLLVLLLALRDLAAVLPFVRRFFAMRAPSK